MAKGDAYNFPVVREAIGYADALYGFKSGFDKAGKVLGVKSGGYWPGNMDKGLTNHQSTVFLFDPDTGQLAALVGGNYLTAVRTAASSAVSIAHLARKDAKVIGMVGAGHQAKFQLRAALEEIVTAGLADEIKREQYAGCYYPRFIAGSTSLSNHSFGTALDLNVPGNLRGTLGEMDRVVVSIFKKWGFAWGGDWSYTDPMHFEMARIVRPG